MTVRSIAPIPLLKRLMLLPALVFLTVTCQGGLTFQSVSAGRFHSCGVTTGGDAYCWGYNGYGQLGDGEGGSITLPTVLGSHSSVPVPVSGGLTFGSLSARGDNHSCGVTTGGDAYCWGRNHDGQLGNGTTIVKLGLFARVGEYVPVPVAGGLTFESVSVGGDHVCGVTTAGAAYCWGENTVGGGGGTLGNGTTANSNVPVAVSGGLTLQSLNAGRRPVCGVTTSGAAYCWGSSGLLGTGRGGGSTVPVAVSGGHTFQSVSAGAWFICGVTTVGDAYCWGQNGSGQLGDGSLTVRSRPVAVSGGHTFRSVSAGSAHACGVTTAGDAYCWGHNSKGELGDGTTTNSNVPVAVSGGHTFQSVSGGGDHVCGVTTAGDAYCWGRNNYGQLGNRTTTDSSVPVLVGLGEEG